MAIGIGLKQDSNAIAFYEFMSWIHANRESVGVAEEQGQPEPQSLIRFARFCSSLWVGHDRAIAIFVSLGGWRRRRFWPPVRRPVGCCRGRRLVDSLRSCCQECSANILISRILSTGIGRERHYCNQQEA